MKVKVRVIGLLAAMVLFVGCESKRHYFPEQIADVEMKLIRFDSAMLCVARATAREDIERLYKQYDGFMPYWVEDILGIPSYDTAYLATALPDFLEDTLYGFKHTNEVEQRVFADTRDIEKALGKAFGRVHWLYPDLPIPEVYLFISGFNASLLFIGEDMAIGGDMYLGSDYEYYNHVVNQYQKQTMRKECIAVDVVSAYLFRHLPYTSTKSRLIDNMLYRGKVMYILAQIFDDVPEYEVMGYTKEQWEWCEKYEEGIWKMMMDKRDLFKTESLVLTSYLNDGPFTAEISQDSPGRLGTWIGWRIIESYMNQHSEVTLQELAAEPDAERLLQESYYRP